MKVIMVIMLNLLVTFYANKKVIFTNNLSYSTINTSFSGTFTEYFNDDEISNIVDDMTY